MGARVTLSAPHSLLPDVGDGCDCPAHLPCVDVEPDFDAALEGADVVMALRMQHERQTGGLLPSLREYCARYQLTSQRVARARPGALVMHPGPMNEGIEIAADVAHGAQSVIQEQVTNGVAVRMALLYLMQGEMVSAL
jgi:aspartate carbamoyltransferase catalytic subunit